jgi:uncharacterized protein YkwD
MKKIILSLNLIFFNLLILGQTIYEPVRMGEFEKILFEEINNYRKSHNVSPIPWSEESYKCAYHQSYYLSDRDIQLSHDQTQDRPNHNELLDLSDRLYEFTTNGPKRMYGTYGVENIATCAFYNKTFTNEEYRKIAIEIISNWSKSPGHRRNILDTTVNQGSVCVLKFECCYSRPVMVLFKKNKGT